MYVSKKRKIARNLFKISAALWLIAYICSHIFASPVIAYISFALIPVWAFFLWYGWDDSNITLADIRPGIVIDVVATDVKKEEK